jgi:hypothetical protein
VARVETLLGISRLLRQTGVSWSGNPRRRLKTKLKKQKQFKQFFGCDEILTFPAMASFGQSSPFSKEAISPIRICALVPMPPGPVLLIS